MIRLFTISLSHEQNIIWAKVVEYRKSPSNFHVTFLNNLNEDLPNEIILQANEGKWELSRESPKITPGLLSSIIEQVQRYLAEKPSA